MAARQRRAEHRGCFFLQNALSSRASLLHLALLEGVTVYGTFVTSKISLVIGLKSETINNLEEEDVIK